jgi:hypothetical protein
MRLSSRIDVQSISFQSWIEMMIENQKPHRQGVAFLFD